MDSNGDPFPDSGQLRRPGQNRNTSSGTSKAALDPVDDLTQQTTHMSISNNNDQTSTASGLNVLAKEFVPSFKVTTESIPQTNAVPEPSYYSNGRTNNWNNQAAASYYDESQVGEVELDDYFALSELKEFIDQVSSMPHLYDEQIENLTDVLNNCIDEDEDIVLQCIVNNIVDQAIIDPNFRYSGVRLCEHLKSNLTIRKAKGSFKEELMSRCQREHGRRNTLVKSSDGSYLRGVTLVIADLYTRLREPQLIDSIPDLVETLLGHPSADNVKTSCLVLKLCGPSLEAKSVKFEPIVQKLKELQESTQSETTKETIKSVLEYRERGWKSAPLPANFYNPYAEGNIPPEDAFGAAGFNEDQYHYYPPQVYGGNENGGNYGQGYPPGAGYDFGDCEDEQNVDVIDAFEEFLRTSGQTKG